MKILIALNAATRETSLSATRLESNTARIERVRARIVATKARAGYKANEKARDLVKRRLELLKTLKVRNKALVAAEKAKAKAAGPVAKTKPARMPAAKVAAKPVAKTKTKTVVAVKKKPGVVERITTTVKNGIKKLTGTKAPAKPISEGGKLNRDDTKVIGQYQRDVDSFKAQQKAHQAKKASMTPAAHAAKSAKLKAAIVDRKASIEEVKEKASKRKVKKEDTGWYKTPGADAAPAAPAKATPSAADLAKIEKHKAELVKFEANHKAYRAKEGPAHPTKYDPVDNEMRRDIDGAKLSIKAAKKAARTNAKDLQSGVKMLGDLKKSFMDRPKPKALPAAAKPKVKRVTHTRAKELKIVDLEQKRKKARAAMAAIKGTKPADDRNRDLYKREINSYTVALKALVANRGKA